MILHNFVFILLFKVFLLLLSTICIESEIQNVAFECTGRAMLISPSAAMGLHNQLDLLVHAIYVGLITNRNVCVRGFMSNFDSPALINIAWIYDLARINSAIRNSGIVQRVRPDDHRINRNISLSTFVAPIHPSDYQECVCLILRGEGASGKRDCPERGIRNIDMRRLEQNYTGIISFLQREDVRNLEKVSFTPGVPFVRLGLENVEDDELIHELHLLIRFSPAFYDTANVLMHKHQIISGQPYTAAHFRLEDDALSQYRTFNYWEYEERPDVKAQNLRFKWPQEMHDVFVAARFLQAVINAVKPNEKLFIGTGLRKSNNRLNFLIDLVEKYYKHVLINDAKSIGENEVVPIKGRETTAIVDYIIASGATHFIGISLSTFSANSMRMVKHASGIKDIYYGKGETRLHERAIAKKHIEKQRSEAEAKLLASFAAKSFMFSVRDMGLPADIPTDLQELNRTLTVPGICSGIQLINMYRQANPHKQPFAAQFPGENGLIPEHVPPPAPSNGTTLA